VDRGRGGFTVAAIVGKLIADGVTTYANQGKQGRQGNHKGTVLYRIIWQDSDVVSYPPDMVWYEPKEHLGTENEALVEYERRAVEEAEEDARAAREDAELEEMEEQEALPPL